MILVITIESPYCVLILVAVYKVKYSEDSFSYTILQYELYRDQRNVVADSVRSTTPIYSFHNHKILSILIVLSIYVNDRKIVEKNLHRGCTYSKSRNIALTSHIEILNDMIHNTQHPVLWRFMDSTSVTVIDNNNIDNI